MNGTKLKQLIKGLSEITVYGELETTISGLSSDSRDVSPGDLFIAKQGLTVDGAVFVRDAVERGASVILCRDYDPKLSGVVQLTHPNVSQIEGVLTSRFYHHPSRELFIVGITGTNGKTTTSFLLKHLLGSCGLIGTIQHVVGDKSYPAKHTTPDVITNQKILREMVECGCQSAVMEVSSHALEQGRVDQIDFDVAVFTNFSQDHLDYHHTLDNYCRAKNRLFQLIGRERFIVINRDDPWCDQIVEGSDANRMTYGIDREADLKASEIRFTNVGTELKITYRGESCLCTIPLVGRFNIYNCLAAMAVCLVRGANLKELIEGVLSLPSVPGRLELVPNEQGKAIFVDYAHTPDALQKVLETLQEIGKGRIITVFGCGGDRDSSKRPKMGEVCAKYSDFCFITSDNPRTEDPAEIVHQIKKGFSSSDSYAVELDRAFAIERAVQFAEPDDTILIAGKGHETYQIFADRTEKFDDRQVVEQICS